MGRVPAVSFAVTNTLVSFAAVSLQVENPARPVASVEFTVSTAVVDSWEAPSIWTAAEIRINGVAVPESDIEGMVEIEVPGIDTHTGGASFTLVGKKYSPWSTVDTFSRATEVTIYLKHGTEGAVIEPATPDFSGYVLGCDMTSTHIPRVRVRCGDAFSRFEKYTTCEEVEPFAGLTRMELTELLGGAAGIDYFEGPDGAVYNKPLQAINKRLPDVLKGLWEPEGGRIYMRGFDTLVVDVPRIKLAPEPPDFVWSKADISAGGLSAIPPEDCPSRWVVRGTSPVVVDEVGISTEVISQEVWEVYAPVTTPQTQAGGGGAITSTGRTPGTPVLRPVRKLEVTTQKRAGLVLSKREREFGWYNPRRARWVTNTGGAGTVGGGFDYVASLIDENGEYVTYVEEKYDLILDRYTVNLYDGDRNLSTQSVKTNRWGRKTRSVRTVGISASSTSTPNSYVYSDDQSYDALSETFGLFEQVNLTYSYATPAPGPLVLTVQDTYGYGAIRSRIDGATSTTYGVLYSGTGQFNENTASWRKLETKTTSTYLSPEKLVIGKSESTRQYAAPEKTDGTYDWGGGLRSDAQFQTFQLTNLEPTSYNVVNEGQIEAVAWPSTGGRRATLILGQLPTTLYQTSPWTRATMQPFEEVLDDPTAYEYFGFERAAFNHDYCLDATEARTIIANRRAAKMGRKLQLTRPDTLAAVGDTILFSSPDDAIHGRFLVARKSRRWGSGMPIAVYRLEERAA